MSATTFFYVSALLPVHVAFIDYCKNQNTFIHVQLNCGNHCWMGHCWCECKDATSGKSKLQTAEQTWEFIRKVSLRKSSVPTLRYLYATVCQQRQNTALGQSFLLTDVVKKFNTRVAWLKKWNKNTFGYKSWPTHISLINGIYAWKNEDNILPSSHKG